MGPEQCQVTPDLGLNQVALMGHGTEGMSRICDWICKNRPHYTRYRSHDSTMNNAIEVWSRSDENFEVITCIVLEIQSLEAQTVG